MDEPVWRMKIKTIKLILNSQVLRWRICYETKNPFVDTAWA